MNALLESPNCFWMSSGAVMIILLTLIVYGGALTNREYYPSRGAQQSLVGAAKDALHARLFFGSKK